MRSAVEKASTSVIKVVAWGLRYWFFLHDDNSVKPVPKISTNWKPYLYIIDLFIMIFKIINVKKYTYTRLKAKV